MAVSDVQSTSSSSNTESLKHKRKVIQSEDQESFRDIFSQLFGTAQGAAALGQQVPPPPPSSDQLKALITQAVKDGKLTQAQADKATALVDKIADLMKKFDPSAMVASTSTSQTHHRHHKHLQELDEAQKALQPYLEALLGNDNDEDDSTTALNTQSVQNALAAQSSTAGDSSSTASTTTTITPAAST